MVPACCKVILPVALPDGPSNLATSFANYPAKVLGDCFIVSLPFFLTEFFLGGGMKKNSLMLNLGLAGFFAGWAGALTLDFSNHAAETTAIYLWMNTPGDRG